MKTPFGIMLALTFCAHIGCGESIEMYPILLDKDATPTVSIAGNVFDLSFTPIEDVLKQDIPEQFQGAVRLFCEYQLALKKGDLATALGHVKNGPSMDVVKKKFDASTQEEIQQRKGIDVMVKGIGVAGGRAVVWYEMRGVSLPGGKFPWLDQLTKEVSGWKMAFDMPINSLSIQMLSVLFDAKVNMKSAVHIDRLGSDFFALGEKETLTIMERGVPLNQSNSPDLVLSVSNTLIKQKTRLIDRIEEFGLAEKESRIVKNAYLLVRAGKPTGDVFVTANGKKSADDPYLWRNGESGYGYCWGIVQLTDGAYFIVGTAHEATTAFFVGADEKISATARGSKGGLYRMLTNVNVMPTAINLGRRALD